jgi:hypothetical protein
VLCILFINIQYTNLHLARTIKRRKRGGRRELGGREEMREEGGRN